MNKTKLYLERAAAIITIVCGGILVLGGCILLAELSNHKYTNAGALRFITWIIILASLALILVAATLCPSPTKGSNGNYLPRTGRVITLIIVNVILAILELSAGSFFYGIIVIVPVILLFISISYKYETVGVARQEQVGVQASPAGANISISTEIANLKKLRDEGVLTEDQYLDSVAKLLK